ncbi:MAG: ABC transporter substrate-binding protein [Betaproteobacteria bacterium]|nr:ABC transporter substrate-binding protein [Betaproteobacteria bacterium]
MSMTRRQFLRQSGAAALAAGALGAPAIARARTKVKVGYLHTVAVDGQIWLGEHTGSFAKHGLDLELTRFDTGLALFQAMVGGSIDILSTGAVISNFPARGQGKVFLINDIEFATAQLWVRADQGVKDFADLKGKKIATTTGTTAHVFLDTALRTNGIDPKEVEIVNQRMPDAVTAFISGAVPAVALWVPFNIPVREKVPGAKKLVDASAYYPKAAIVDGWAARNDYYDKHKDVLANVIRGWESANDFLVTKPDEALPILQKSNYQEVALKDLKEMYAAEKAFTAKAWRKLYVDGTVVKWLQQVTDFFVRTGGIDNPVPASTYFDPSIYLKTVKA